MEVVKTIVDIAIEVHKERTSQRLLNLFCLMKEPMEEDTPARNMYESALKASVDEFEAALRHALEEQAGITI